MYFKNKNISRREFINKLKILAGSVTIAPFLPDLSGKNFSLIKKLYAATGPMVYVVKNGTPTSNMQKVIELAGGIESYVDKTDVVLLKPNLQWPNQGYTHTEAAKAIIDIILNRPGGFTGEIIIAENISSDEDREDKGWAASPQYRQNNWPDMNYNELVDWYHTNGILNVSSAKLSSSSYPIVSGPSEGHGFVTIDYTLKNSESANGRVCRLYYPIIRSAYSDKLIDTKYGVWSEKDRKYTDQQVKLFFLPTLNNHGGSGREDYAGATGAVKCHLGFVRNLWKTGDGTYGLHQIGYEHPDGTVPMAVGEAVGELITNIIQPTFYICVAEYAGWGGRTWVDGAEHTKTIGLCKDPVTLDYWMGKNVLGPSNGGSESSYLDPSNNNNFRDTLLGCNSKGVGSLDENEMLVQVYDYDNPPATKEDIEKKILQFKNGKATKQEVRDLIKSYMEG